MLTKNDFSIVKSFCWYNGPVAYQVQCTNRLLRKPNMRQFKFLAWEFCSSQAAQSFINLVCSYKFSNLAALYNFLTPSMFYYTVGNGHSYMAINTAAFIKKHQKALKKAQKQAAIKNCLAA